MEKLKPCPFCGSEAHICKIRGEKIYLVKCWNYRECSILPRTKEYENKEEAIREWNRRSKENE